MYPEPLMKTQDRLLSFALAVAFALLLVLIAAA